jgi:hypothetical protein
MEKRIINLLAEIYDKTNERTPLEGNEQAFRWIVSLNTFLQYKAEVKSIESDKWKVPYSYFRGISILIQPEIDEVYACLVCMCLTKI